MKLKIISSMTCNFSRKRIFHFCNGHTKEEEGAMSEKINECGIWMTKKNLKLDRIGSKIVNFDKRYASNAENVRGKGSLLRVKIVSSFFWTKNCHEFIPYQKFTVKSKKNESKNKSMYIHLASEHSMFSL